jgi:large subunit ribosomal protein L16
MNSLNRKKLRKFRLKGVKINNKKLYFGFYGLVSLDTGRIDSLIIKSIISVVNRKIKLNKNGKFWFYLNNSIPVTQIPIGTRMGKGKGNIIKHVAFARKGQIICELTLSSKEEAIHILKIISSKLPIKARIVTY